MPANFGSFNLLPVLVAAVLTFLIGGVWYTALFGKLWIELNGFTEEQMKEMHARRPPPLYFSGLFLCYIIVALAMSVLVVAFDIRGIGAGMCLGSLIWVVVAAVAMTEHISSLRPFGVYAIGVSYQLIYLILTGALLAWWR